MGISWRLKTRERRQHSGAATLTSVALEKRQAALASAQLSAEQRTTCEPNASSAQASVRAVRHPHETAAAVSSATSSLEELCRLAAGS
ncbi:hypothetical protein V5799_003930 [Amblyomma americanum]|uniref:Uncharacterized protein n=1 Tax=Amblyomma americanum TaxID=6943 RepID=A0AAQ4D7K2_AMBAM